MIVQENMLYTASSQIIKVWSLDTLAQVSEISAHTGLIKALAKSDGIIFSSSGNVIKL
jgi:hypothetical protein